MTNYDVEPAASEPNSIAPTAVDVNLWEIDLRNLSSGERLDFAVPTYADLEPTMLVPRVKVRAGRRVLGVMTTVAVVAGLGLATFLARPSVERAFASSNAKSRVAKTTLTAAAPPPPPAPAPAPAPAPVPAPSPVVKAEAAPPSPPTLSANDLPNAPKAKPKRGGPKRAPK